MNEYLRNQGYQNVNVEFVEDHPAGDADDQAALREQVMEAYRSTRRGKDPTDEYAR